jgi:hypothetical protein
MAHPLVRILEVQIGVERKLVLYSKTWAVTGLSFTMFIMAPDYQHKTQRVVDADLLGKRREQSSSSQAVHYPRIDGFAAVSDDAHHDLIHQCCYCSSSHANFLPAIFAPHSRILAPAQMRDVLRHAIKRAVEQLDVLVVHCDDYEQLRLAEVGPGSNGRGMVTR